jgi:hypothetical protein
MVVSKTRSKPPRYEDSLNGVLLPPAFAGGKWHWPGRKAGLCTPSKIGGVRMTSARDLSAARKLRTKPVRWAVRPSAPEMRPAAFVQEFISAAASALRYLRNACRARCRRWIR